MTIYRIHPDRLNYELMSVPVDEVLNKLGREYPFHIDPTPRSYAKNWQPLDVSFYDSTEGKHKVSTPDISIEQGRLFLSDYAYNRVSELIKDIGEFLPVNHGTQRGFIFNPLQTAETYDALDKTVSVINEWGDLQTLGFIENNLSSIALFKSEFEGYSGLFCNDEFKNVVEEANLNGIVFSVDLGNIFPADESARNPMRH